MPNKIYISNDDFMDATKKLAKKISKFGLKKDRTAIIAIARGGLVPAQYLAYALNIKEIFTVGSSLYEGETKGDEQSITNLMMIDYESYDSFIVVDDIYDTGETMQGILDGLSEVAAVFKEDCLFLPAVTYTQHSKKDMETEGILYGKKIKKIDGNPPWLVFPWDNMFDDKE